jgi:hypothetical protein
MVPLGTDWIYQLFIKETTKKQPESPEPTKSQEKKLLEGNKLW